MAEISDVDISVRVVPDGLNRAAQKLKLSLVLRPVPGGTTVHLRNWPSDIEAVLQAAMRPSPSSPSPSIVIRYSIDTGVNPLPTTPTTIALTGSALQSALKSSPSSPNATNLWQRIFTYPHADQIEDLRWVLSNPSSLPAGIRNDAPVLASRHAVLATALEQLRARHTASHLAILELLKTDPNQAKTLGLSLRTEREVSLEYLKSKAFALFGTFQPATSLDQINPTTTAMEGTKLDPGVDSDHPPRGYHGPTTLRWRNEAQQAAIAARLVRRGNQNELTARGGGGDIGSTISGAVDSIGQLLNGDAQKLEIFSAFSRGAATPLNQSDEYKYLQYGAEHALSNLPDKGITLIFTNSGGEIQNLQITDKVCNQPMHTGHFAAGDLQTISGFCVRDASKLVAEISINADGADNSPASPVPANSTVDVATGRVILSSTASRDSARRKFFGITQRPSLATFLGLISDLELPLAQFPLPSGTTAITGKISAWIGDPSTVPTSLVPTAFKLSLSAGSPSTSHDYFGPISKYQNDQSDNLTSSGQIHIDDGMVNLNVATGDNLAYRYVMLSCDAQAGAISTEGSASAALSQERQGIAQDQITTKLQTLRTRGIAIIDMLHAESTSRDIQNLPSPSSNPSALYAEDLLMGYRLDVGIYEDDDGPVWRSTAERAVAYDDPLMIPTPGHRWTGPFPERDDAFFRPLARVAQQNTPDPSVDTQVVAYETVVTWRGASLAFPTPKVDTETSTPHDPDKDLAVDSIISPVLPDDPARRSTRHSVGLPALRFLDRVATSLRCVWLNGGGLSLDEANQRRQDPSKKLWLDRGLDQIQVPDGSPPEPVGFQFLRYEEAPGPTWHLHADDRVTRSSNDALKRLPGDQIDRLVLRAPVNSQWGRPRRWLLPANASFDLAELHGVFDKAPELENTPSGAFKYIKRNAQGFPEAVDGAVEYLAPGKNPKQTDSRGTVLVSGAPEKLAEPYYPDPLAETLYAAFRRGDKAPEGYPDTPINYPFNPRDQWPKHATPVLVELVPMSGATAPRRGTISFAAGGTSQGQSLAAAPKITVALAPGEEVDLQLWCAPASAATLAEHWVIPSASAFVKNAFTDGAPKPFQAANSVMSEAIERGLVGDHGAPKILMSGSPTPNLSATRRLRLVYPVEQPLLAPAFASPLDFRMIRVIDSVIRGKPPGTPQPVNPDPAQHLKDVWQNYVGTRPSPHPATWTSEAAATRAFFVGTLLIEKASTSSVLCHARWFDFVDDATTIKKVGGEFKFSPPKVDDLPWRSPPLFTIANSSVEPGGVASKLDLLQDDTLALRALNFDFGDTKARRLFLQLVAHSRFDRYFIDPNDASATGVGKFDRASDPQEIWLDSTAKPAAPVLLPTTEALPVFSFTTKPLKNGFLIERVCSIQLKMPIPSWFSSGEGELLALVFPDGLFGTIQDERNSASALERTDPDKVFVSPAGDYLTRRGHDPIRQSGHLGPFITYEDLYDKSGLAKGKPVNCVNGLSITVTPDDSGGLFPPIPSPTPPSQPPSTITMKVSIAAYKPTVDELTGKTWNCLVRIDPGQSFWPFVRLSLARYQKHAMLGMELSTPVVTWAKIGPRRTASVEFDDEKNALTLTVEGQGFHLANPGPVFVDQHPDVDRPYLNIRLVRAARGSQTGQTSWLPVIHNGKKVEWLNVRADYDFEGYVRWITSIPLPKPRREEHYGIIVEEYFKMPSDQLSGDDKDKGSILVDGHVLFAAVLDLSAEAAYALPNGARH